MELAERLQHMVRIARRAGDMIVEARQQQNFSHQYKGGDELVTEVDVAVDQMIADELEALAPGEARLTEELTPDRSQLERPGALWIVDPIDGTVNFAYGHAHVAVSIAWAHDGELQAGVVHAPFLGETFTALRGEGAWLNQQSISTSPAEKLERSLVATGFPYARDKRAPLIRRLNHVVHACRDIRRNGSAALDLCHVACGQLDAYYESVSPWDFAAGLLIAREAGARTGHLYPCPDNLPADLYGENLLVSAVGIHATLGNLLRDADAGKRVETD
ncbi:inositol monophosphatase family protein [Salinicola avicenniae]|uniref:inositol monophosphatase family protein n=1 Tax=Salinicola avicenniae TaxID=2916836 RepID=UPI002073AD1B|nr:MULTISPECIES: inositol monophosphatase family protein [unclassified Salinicola]